MTAPLHAAAVTIADHADPSQTRIRLQLDPDLDAPRHLTFEQAEDLAARLIQAAYDGRSVARLVTHVDRMLAAGRAVRGEAA